MRLRMQLYVLCCLTLSLAMAGCGGGVSKSPASPTAPMITAPTIATQPTDQTVSTGQAAVFSVTAAGSSPLTYQWQRCHANCGRELSQLHDPVGRYVRQRIPIQRCSQQFSGEGNEQRGQAHGNCHHHEHHHRYSDLPQ
jgi:hypothetical protein